MKLTNASIQKIFLYTLLLAIAILLLFILLGPSYLPREDEKYMALVKLVQQKKDIVTSIASTDSGKLKETAEKYAVGYDKELKKVCRRQYIIKTNCKLDELTKSHLLDLSSYLENAIEEIVKVQDEVN